MAKKKTRRKTTKTAKAPPKKAQRKYRILSLDGGGIRGLITAVWLARLEDQLGEAVRDRFDLIAGTSTGSILACALSMGTPAREIQELYVEHARDIFPSTTARLWSRFARTFTEGVSAPKYDGVGLERILRSQFGAPTIPSAARCSRRAPSRAYMPKTSRVDMPALSRRVSPIFSPRRDPGAPPRRDP